MGSDSTTSPEGPGRTTRVAGVSDRTRRSQSIKGVILDLSGVLYVSGQAVTGSVAALGRLRAAGIPVRMVTNTTRKSAEAVVAQLNELGFAVAPQELVTAPHAARRHLQHHGLRPYLVVHPDLRATFGDLAQHDPTAVVIGDAGEGFTYSVLNHAFRLVTEGAPLIAMGRNRYFREADGLSLDAGPFVAALEYASDSQALVVGKPAPALFHSAVESLGLAPREVLMVGDDVEADVAGAQAAGLAASLVRTGKYRAGDESRLEQPCDYVGDDLSAVVDWLLG